MERRGQLWLLLFAALVGLLAATGCVSVDRAAPEPSGETDATAGEENSTGEENATGDPTTPSQPSNPNEQTTATPQTPGQESNSDSDEAGESSDRLVIETSDGQLFTIKPDGTDRVDLTDPSGGTDNSQASWSPDGSRIAWTQLEPSSGAVTLRTDRFDGSSPIDTAVESPPFYLSWAPTSTSVAYLSNSVGGFDLGLASVNPEDPEAAARRLDRGAPYYFSWGPDDDELLVHASDFRLDRIDISGQTRIIDEDPSAFATPIWAADVDSLIYGRAVGGAAEVVATGMLGEGGQTLVRYEGLVRMVVSPAMNRVALVAYPLDSPGQQGDGSIVTASAPLAPVGALQAQTDPPTAPNTDEEPSVLVPGELTQVGIYGGDAWSIPTTEVMAFYWDPTGSILAWLEPTNQGRVQWWFTDDTGVWPGPEFTPSTVFATEYLPFFDQYAQSHTFFSPEGDALAFSGTLVDGQEGVFVVSTAAGSEPTKIADGVVAQWSPTSAGGGAQSPL